MKSQASQCVQTHLLYLHAWHYDLWFRFYMNNDLVFKVGAAIFPAIRVASCSGVGGYYQGPVVIRC